MEIIGSTSMKELLKITYDNENGTLEVSGRRIKNTEEANAFASAITAVIESDPLIRATIIAAVERYNMIRDGEIESEIDAINELLSEEEDNESSDNNKANNSKSDKQPTKFLS